MVSIFFEICIKNPAIFDKKSALSDWHGDIEDAKIITDTAIPALRPGW